jgi:hypothetical protein
MANRRLGVEYAVTNFDVVGTKDLPDPDSHAPSAEASVNRIQEYRPDFRGDVTASNVKPYIDTVVEDVVGGWEGTMEGEELDRKRVEEAVNVYWSRLCVSGNGAIYIYGCHCEVRVKGGLRELIGPGRRNDIPSSNLAWQALSTRTSWSEGSKISIGDNNRYVAALHFTLES